MVRCPNTTIRSISIEIERCCQVRGHLELFGMVPENVKWCRCCVNHIWAILKELKAKLKVDPAVLQGIPFLSSYIGAK